MRSASSSSASSASASAPLPLAPSAEGWREQRRLNYLYGSSSGEGGGGRRLLSRASASSAGSESHGSSGSLSAHASVSRQLQSMQRQLRRDVAAADGSGGIDGGAAAAASRARMAQSPFAQTLRRPKSARPATPAAPATAEMVARTPPVPASRIPRPSSGAMAARLAERLDTAASAAAAAATARRQVPAPPPPPAPVIAPPAAVFAADGRASPAHTSGSTAGSIDARLEQLYAFLRVAQAGGTGALPSPPSVAPYAPAALFAPPAGAEAGS
jgi:hypothetical protein